MDLHLSVCGGLTGDMFIAAVLDAFPYQEERVVAAIDAVDAAHPVACAVLAHADAGVSGRRFEIVPFERYFGHIPFAFTPEEVAWYSVQEWLRAAQIKRAVRAHAVKLFELIARADRGRLVPAPWHVISQVVGAAAVIDALGPVRWTISPLPAGVSTTPTAGAILDYLCPRHTRSLPPARMSSPTRSGTGFGSPPAANSYLRLLCFDEGSASFAAPDISTQVPTPVTDRTGQRPAQ